MLKLIDGVLQLIVKHGAVRHHNHRVELFLAIFIVQAGKLVGCPGNRVRFARPRAVLNQVFIACPFHRGGGDQFVDHVPLVVPRENQALAFVLQANGIFFFNNVQMHKTGEDFQQIVRQQHLIPQVAGGVVVGIFRDVVPRAAVMGAFVKRQEEGFIAIKFGRHKHFVLADGKVHQRPAFKGQQRLRFIGAWIFRQTRFLVLRNGVLHRLLKFRLQFQRRHWQAIDEQHQVDTPFLCLATRFFKCSVRRMWAVNQLRYDAADILLVARQGFRIEAMFRLKLAQGKTGVMAFDTMTQYAEGAVSARKHIGSVDIRFFQLRHQRIKEMTLGIGRINFGKLLPLLRLCGLHKGQCILRVQRTFAIVAVGFATNPTFFFHLSNYLILENQLFGAVHAHAVASCDSSTSCLSGATQSRTSIFPVTAAEIRAVRRSCNNAT
ncbi:Uncharacterised protein [Klebsiella quasipneumoniae]|nr:Uncharacterised protein [Klebsiella quasipneumoniae]